MPIVLGAAASEHKWGPAALAAGLAISFVTIGIFVASIGFAIGLDGAFFRIIGGLLLTALGLALLVPRLSARMATASGPISGWTDHWFGGFSRKGLSGQFGLGILRGAV
ncbi:MAG: cytochrome c biogenesis protein CcdA, partial [Rhizobiales bacterium]|nr:cytochrome c biogenesis protein CcdA [Hyphomicrobiales bacterium]